jgi:type IV pilus assembly protein PilV
MTRPMAANKNAVPPNRPMTNMKMIPSRNSGFTMIEVLVALLIITLGLLGLAGLQARMQQAEFESYQRTQALVLLYDMVDRINVNRVTAPCFVITTNATAGTPYLGAGSGALPACSYGTAADNANALAALAEFDNLLKGAAETRGGADVGAMVDARGCVIYDSTTELLDAGGAVMPGTGIYTVTLAWQGTADTFAPTVNCANTLYGAETKRRVVSTTFRLAHLK